LILLQGLPPNVQDVKGLPECAHACRLLMGFWAN